MYKNKHSFLAQLTQIHEVGSKEASDLSERGTGSDGQVPEQSGRHFPCDAEVYVERAYYRRLARNHQ